MKPRPEGAESKAAPNACTQAKTEDAAKSDATAQKASAAAPEKRADGAADAKRPGKSRGKPEDDGPADDVKRLRWIDAHSENARFVAWHAFHHPELGDVEIGGFAPYALVEPPEADRADIAKKDVEFVIEVCGDLSRLKIVDAVAKDLGNGLWK